MAASNDTASGKISSNADTQGPSLKEYTRAHLTTSNDCDWLHAFVASEAISAGKASPAYRVKLYYKEKRDASAIITKDFGTGSFALLELKSYLASKAVYAVILCHRDSSQVDPELLDLLWARFKLEVPFIRQHFDYKGFRDEPGCPSVIRNRLKEEEDMNEDHWTLGGRWNPVQLPSETRASVLRLSLDSECLSVRCKGGVGEYYFYQMSGDVEGMTVVVVIALVRSRAIYKKPLSPRTIWRKRESYSCAVDLFAAIADSSSLGHEFPRDSTENSCYIVQLYARLLVLRCYEDYNLRHDTQPIHLDDSDRVTSQGNPYILAMYHRRLELVKLKQNLSAYLGPLAPEQKPDSICKGSDSTDEPHRQKLQSLLTDIEMLMSLYDNTMRIYEWHTHETDSDYKAQLASEQLEEARESKVTAISLGRLSTLAAIYIPINFVCAMLGMNLRIFGQGTVPVWVFLMLLVVFALPTYLPIFLPTIDEQTVRVYKLTYRLAWRSVPAGFWFLAFALTHNDHQNFEVMHSGLAQVLLKYTGSRTKGWTDERNDEFFGRATWGSEAFWKDKVKKIFLAVEELNSIDAASQRLPVQRLTV